VGIKIHRQLSDKIIPATQNVFSFRAIPNCVASKKNAIILARKVGIGPVGCQTIRQSEAPP
jgi:hypothetical protein